MLRSSLRGSGLLLAIGVVLTGCGGDDGDSRKAQIRLLNASPGYRSLDLYVDKDSDDSSTPKSSGVGYETAADYVSVDSDTYVVRFRRNGITSTLLTLSSEKLTDESHATYVAYGSDGHFATLKIAEDVSDADNNKTKVQLVNTAEAGALDVYFTEPSVSLNDATPQFAAVNSGSSASALSIDSGTYRLRVTGAGDTSDLRLDLSSVTLESRKVVTYIMTGTQGGVLVNAITLPQQGSLSVTHNTKARVRGANGIANGTTASASIGGVTVLNNVAVGLISSRYTQVEAGSVAVNVSVDGAPVSAPSQTLTAGGDYTLLLWSDVNGTQTTLVNDDNRLPNASGKTKLRVLNGMSAFGGAITLNVDFFPIAEEIALGTASDYTEVDSTDSDLEVINSATSASLLTRDSVSFATASVYTLFMSGGGTTAVGGTVRRDR